MAALTTSHETSTSVEASTATAEALTTNTGAETDVVEDTQHSLADGADASQATPLPTEQSTLEWLAYSVSLNYNR
ncbi:hypothetical protein BGZ98_006662, partial [Dissophora globulifera]